MNEAKRMNLFLGEASEINSCRLDRIISNRTADAQLPRELATELLRSVCLGHVGWKLVAHRSYISVRRPTHSSSSHNLSVGWSLFHFRLLLIFLPLLALFRCTTSLRRRRWPGRLLFHLRSLSTFLSLHPLLWWTSSPWWHGWLDWLLRVGPRWL